MFSLTKCISSFRFAFNGVFIFFKYENNARVHLLASIFVVFIGFFFHIPMASWLWLSFAIGLVWITEAFNTAIEKLVDLVSPGYNQQAGIIKDISAGAVLLAAINAVIIGIIIFKDHILLYIKGLF